MRASTLKVTLKALYKVARSVVITGAPGGGKTTIVHETANELDVHYLERHMPTMLVEDFGIPVLSGEFLTYKIPDWFPAKGSKWDDGRGGILCFDDRNQCTPDLQKVLANIMQARNLHGVPMADGWMVVSTGNRQADRAGANRVLTHLSNRETELELETHLDDWTSWAIDHEVRMEVVSFLRFRPNLLHDFDPQRNQNPTPRSWVDGVSQTLGLVPPEAEYEVFKGAVGEGAAAEFTGFMRIFRKLPNPDTVLMHPDTSDVPSDPATLYALTGALAQRAGKGNMERLVKYLTRVPKEFSVLCISQAVRRDAELAETKAFVEWSVGNQDVLW